MNRRSFLSAAAYSQFAGANNRIRAGQIGCGGRGSYELRICAGIPDVEIAAVADVYPPLIGKARELAPKAEGSVHIPNSAQNPGRNITRGKR